MIRIPFLPPLHLTLSLRLAAPALVGLILLVWLVAYLHARSTGIPVSAKVVAVDQRGWNTSAGLYVSQRYHLVGWPDYVLQVHQQAIPVEAKPSRRGKARPWDLVQLGAYLLLIEETTHQRPPYGLLAYRDRTYRVSNSRRLQQTVGQVIAQVQAARAGQQVRRHHHERARCRACGYRPRCRRAL